MSHRCVVVGDALFNVEAVTHVKWKQDTLYVDFIGGRFCAFKGDEAEKVWRLLQSVSLNLDTGEQGKGFTK